MSTFDANQPAGPATDAEEQLSQLLDELALDAASLDQRLAHYREMAAREVSQADDALAGLLADLSLEQQTRIEQAIAARAPLADVTVAEGNAQPSMAVEPREPAAASAPAPTADHAEQVSETPRPSAVAAPSPKPAPPPDEGDHVPFDFSDTVRHGEDGDDDGGPALAVTAEEAFAATGEHASIVGLADGSAANDNDAQPTAVSGNGDEEADFFEVVTDLEEVDEADIITSSSPDEVTINVAINTDEPPVRPNDEPYQNDSSRVQQEPPAAAQAARSLEELVNTRSPSTGPFVPTNLSAAAVPGLSDEAHSGAGTTDSTQPATDETGKPIRKRSKSGLIRRLLGKDDA